MLPPQIPALQTCHVGKEYFVSFRSYADQAIFGSAVMCVQMKQLMRFYSSYRRKVGRLMCAVPRVRIRAYCIMPDSYTVLLTPVVEGGIEYFCSAINEAVSAYYAVLFKSPKRVLEEVPVVSEVLNKTECLSAIRCINSMPFSSGYVRDGDIHDYPWCSMHEILTSDREGVIDDELVAEHFADVRAFIDFIRLGKV